MLKLKNNSKSKSKKVKLAIEHDEILLEDHSSERMGRKSHSYSKLVMKGKYDPRVESPMPHQSESKRNSHIASSSLSKHDQQDQISSEGVSINTFKPTVSNDGVVFKKAKLIEDHNGLLKLKSGTDE
jgi:hypothetical protein